ncbi:MAG: hypothetical protein EHM13_15670 [Acidobacteria bacterium]|nr:MAG: hypothetical protein EHM13_15670 [Acidobacteriota bacterium]
MLGALPEDVPLQLLDRGLYGRELLAYRRKRLGLRTELVRLQSNYLLCRGDGACGVHEVGLEALGLLSPLAAMVVAAHREV